MQSKCRDCERFKNNMKNNTTPGHVEVVRAEHLEHVKSIFRDCVVYERIQKSAYDATTDAVGVPLARSVLNMDMGAMDAMLQFKCPDAKMLEKMWRPSGA